MTKKKEEENAFLTLIDDYKPLRAPASLPKQVAERGAASAPDNRLLSKGNKVVVRMGNARIIITPLFRQIVDQFGGSKDRTLLAYVNVAREMYRLTEPCIGTVNIVGLKSVVRAKVPPGSPLRIRIEQEPDEMPCRDWDVLGPRYWGMLDDELSLASRGAR